jgi:hypothetical protein
MSDVDIHVELLPTVVSRLQMALHNRGLTLSPRLDLHDLGELLLQDWAHTLQPGDFEHLQDAAFEVFVSLVVAIDALGIFEYKPGSMPANTWLQDHSALNALPGGIADSIDALHVATGITARTIGRVALPQRNKSLVVQDAETPTINHGEML